jgi:polyhydroxyalkanoate synthesis regulator phasin
VTRTTKIALVAACAAALTVAGGGAALAAGDVFSSNDESKAIIEDAAGQLGIEPSELQDALQQALENRIDEAVDEGRLTEEQAQRLKERLDQAPRLFGPFGFGFGGPGPWHGPWRSHFGSFATLDTAASYLGLTESELRAKLADGKSLADVAAEEGKSVEGLVQALIKASTERIDEAVANGKLTKAQADALKENLEERTRDRVEREPGSFGKNHRFGHGFFAPRFWRGDRPAPFAGPRA